jgi:hypothetical protein
MRLLGELTLDQCRYSFLVRLVFGLRGGSFVSMTTIIQFQVRHPRCDPFCLTLPHVRQPLVLESQATGCRMTVALVIPSVI